MRKPPMQFLVEMVLTLALTAAVWFLARRNWDQRNILYAVLASLAAFLSLIYYGTSAVVTPSVFLRPFYSGLLGLQDKKKFPSKPVISSGAREELPASPKPVVVQSAPTVDAILRTGSQSASKLAARMERRTNTHLILGVGMGLLGLLIWYISFFINGANYDTRAYHIDWTAMVWASVPRVTILLFIELLAGFFLRQYRVGVEDLKYFLELERRAEGRRVAYMIFEETNAPELKQQLANVLVESTSSLALGKDQTTTLLEVLKTEKNPTLELLDLLTNRLSAAAKEVRSAVKDNKH
jgi:hypothetical protein